MIFFCWLACSVTDGGTSKPPQPTESPETTLPTEVAQSSGDTGTSTSPAFDTSSSGHTGPSGGPGESSDTGATAGPTGDTADPTPDPPLTTHCEADLGAGTIANVPVPKSSCSYLPFTSTGPGASVLAVDLARATLIGTEDKVLGASVDIVPLPTGTLLAVGSSGEAGFYGYGEAPGEVWVTDASSLIGTIQRGDVDSVLIEKDDPWDDRNSWGAYLQHGHLSGGSAMELVVGAWGYHPTYVVPLPLPLGESFAAELAVASIDKPGGHLMGYPDVGDVDGDGQDDLAFSQIGLSTCPNALLGGVGVYLGPLTTLDAHPDSLPRWDYDIIDLDTHATSQRCSGNFGPPITFDIDGDGDQEVVVSGDHMADIAPTDAIEPQAHGGFAVFDGGEPGPRSAADARVVVYGECSMDLGVETFELGDVTGDGHADLGVSAVNARFDGEADRGAIFVASELHRAEGTVPISAVSCAWIFAEGVYDDLWQAVGLGDLDGDGYDDFAVGASSYGSQGSVYIFLGPVGGPYLASDADLTIRGEGGAFGFKLRAGDLDGDSVPDLVVAAQSYDDPVNGKADGRVYVFSGVDMVAELP